MDEFELVSGDNDNRARVAYLYRNRVSGRVLGSLREESPVPTVAEVKQSRQFIETVRHLPDLNADRCPVGIEPLLVVLF
jgi:hypothetical protein